MPQLLKLIGKALGYGVCPAVMRGESVISEFVGKPIYGFYAVKVL